ncbi:MAG: cell wall hydrolase [Candidatus Woesearchaeota archaeon]
MNNSIFYSISADKLTALTAYGEARNEGAEGMIAVINVIRNRTKDSNQFADQSILAATGSVYHAVILKPYQFSPYNASDSQRPKMELIAAGFDSYLLSDANLSKAYELSRMMFTGVLTDNTYGATYFHATYVTPAWASTIPLIGQIGNHIFYGYKTITGIIADVIAENPVTTAIVGFFATLGVYFILRRRHVI